MLFSRVLVHAGLDDVATDDGRNDRRNNLKNLFNSFPFHSCVIILKVKIRSKKQEARSKRYACQRNVNCVIRK
jgi:hypothetical protein